MQIIFWTVRFSSWNNLSCFFSLFLLMPLFFEHWEILFSHLSAPRTTLSLVYTSRKLRPSPALFTSCPQKPGLSVAHASQSFGIGCSFGFGRSMPSASSSLASFSISYACTYFVHNLYTKTNTATNHVSNLHPRCLYAGTQNTAKNPCAYTRKKASQPPLFYTNIVTHAVRFITRKN